MYFIGAHHVHAQHGLEINHELVFDKDAEMKKHRRCKQVLLHAVRIPFCKTTPTVRRTNSMPYIIVSFQLQSVAKSDFHLYAGSSTGHIVVFALGQVCLRLEKHRCHLHDEPQWFCEQVRSTMYDDVSVRGSISHLRRFGGYVRGISSRHPIHFVQVVLLSSCNFLLLDVRDSWDFILDIIICSAAAN